MRVTLIDKEHACRLVFAGSLTTKFARRLEDLVIDVLRRYTEFEIDLGKVREIDAYGIYLLGVLNRVAGPHVQLVDCSPAVQRAYEQLAPRRGAWLGSGRDEGMRCSA
ncbi:MAG: hypothetical protein H6R10_638 [Rhodocyclaceae bacterium]|nr:hypothetical protein [Rhodocyclaceae bacterium]